MKHYISAARLNTYRSVLKLKDDDQILKAYYWNKALCGAIYPAMQTLEVTLRNALNEAVKQHHAGKYAGNDWWFEHIAKDVQNKKIQKMSSGQRDKWLKPNGKRKKQGYAEQAVLNVQRELSKEGRLPLLHDDVISRATFGYWTGFLGKDYEDVTNHSLLWPNLLPFVFPNYAGKVKRHRIEAIFKQVKDLRNRMSHHEPIWKFYRALPNGQADYAQPIYGLKASLGLLSSAYEQVLTVIRWMSEDRYQSFVDGRLDIEFRKLCCVDGFYSFVDPSRVSSQIGRSRFMREPIRHLQRVQEGTPVTVTKNRIPCLVVGVNSPKF